MQMLVRTDMDLAERAGAARAQARGRSGEPLEQHDPALNIGSGEILVRALAEVNDEAGEAAVRRASRERMRDAARGLARDLDQGATRQADIGVVLDQARDVPVPVQHCL